MSISIIEHDRIMRLGQPAEARVNGVLRGGHIYEGRFYAAAAVNVGVIDAPICDISDLRIHKSERIENEAV